MGRQKNNNKNAGKNRGGAGQNRADGVVNLCEMK